MNAVHTSVPPQIESMRAVAGSSRCSHCQPLGGSGEPVGMTYLTPRTRDDLVRRRVAMKQWSDFSGGFLGRTPDYLNVAFMADYGGRRAPGRGRSWHPSSARTVSVCTARTSPGSG